MLRRLHTSHTRRFLIATAAFCLLFSGAAQTQYGDWLLDFQGDEAGASVSNSLQLPIVSAGVLARGLASSGGMMDATDAPLYTANTAYFASNRFSLNHYEYLLGLRKEYTGACFPILDIGTLGWFSHVFTYGRFKHARDINEDPSKPRALDFSVGATYARKLLGDFLAGGLSAAYFEGHLESAVARGFVGGADIAFRPVELVDGHLYATNLGPAVTYTSGSEPLPIGLGASVEFHPLQHNVDITDRFDLDLGVGAYKLGDNPVRAGASAEGRFGNHVFARLGYEYTYGNESYLDGISAGGGFRISKYGVDFGWKNQSSDLGMTWALSAHYYGEEIVPRSAEEFYKVAHKHFTKQRYHRAITYAKKALALDPDMWRAHTLIARARAAMRRAKGLEVLVLYTGNNLGRLAPLPVEEGGLGGLARQATVVKQLRGRYRIAFAVDVGNMLVRSSHSLKVDVIDQYYSATAYDALALGEQEFAFGLKRRFQEHERSGGPFVCSNFAAGLTPRVVRKRVVDKDRYRLGILSVIDPALLAAPADNVPLEPIVGRMRELLQDADIRKADVRIMVVHASWPHVQALAQQFPQIDFIVCGSLNQQFETPMQVGRTRILSAGAHGRYVGACALRFNQNDSLISCSNSLVPLGSEIVPDPHIAELVRRTSMRIDLAEQGISAEELVAGTVHGAFCFVSDRYGTPEVFLKVVDQQAEFPLTAGGMTIGEPVLSFACGKVAYRGRAREERTEVLMIMDANGANKRELPIAGNVEDIAFSPDGRWLYCSVATGREGTTDIVRIRPEGHTEQEIVAWEGSSERAVAFSSDTSLMAFCSDREDDQHVYLSSLDGEEPLRITELSGNHFAPAFSPNGAYVAYLSDRTGFGGKADLWVYDRRKGKQVQLTRNAHIAELCWLDDSRTIVYSSGVNLRDFNTIDLETRENRKLIVTDSIKTYSEVSPQRVKYRDGYKLLYTRAYQDGEKQIYWVNPDGTGDQRLVNSSRQDWLAP